MKLQKIKYSDLNKKAQEMYNFQKVAAVLADYGFTCMWLHNDWKGADFIAVHVYGDPDMKIQLKGGLSFAKKYKGKDIYICFMYKGDTYLYPHDEVLSRVEQRISDKKWKEKGTYFQTKLSGWSKDILDEYKI
jgi:hypothetical protein